ncbi:UDP-N-acetylmuramoyl-L-alanine--D-glutamate ligase [Patescibacteria group bacterium]|nr:UDP-N-acetylmuramoyl-L-alanine--D-glutamate ligase [Patescibacteria group bacterium]
MYISELKSKKLLILGFAREGRDTYKFLRKHFPNKVFGIADQKESLPNLPKKRVRLHLGRNYLKAMRQYDVVIKSPGIPLRIVKPLLKKEQHLTSETDIFFSECQGAIVGITGSKGKSTTASLICSMLKKGGKKAKLVGNIGTPALQFLSKQTPEDIFVYELSSFQLEHLNKSPHIAVFLNLYEEHLNHHGSFAAYKKAKANITLFQTSTDFLIYNAKDNEVSKIAKKSRAQKIPFAPETVSKNPSFIAPIEPALLVGKLFGITPSAMKEAIKSFKPLPHRLERIGMFKGIVFVNDSLATIPEATILALDALSNTVTTLIAGGFDRGVSVTKLARRIEQSKIKTLILFPTTGETIFKSLKKKPKNIFFVKSMKEAVQLAYLHTKTGKICLLSPAASSFNLFYDYQDRGNQFKGFVKRYG